MNSSSALHLFIEGGVQGVGFCNATQKKAFALRLTGWVRNLPDGRVEVLIVGPEDVHNTMLTWCYDGPAFAKVNNIKIT
jgi:acylphosphatase